MACPGVNIARPDRSTRERCGCEGPYPWRFLDVKSIRRRPRCARAFGAVFPDLPMYLLYLWDRAVLGVPGVIIWSERYFEPGWQRLIDLSHSLPIGLVVLAVASFAHARDPAAGSQATPNDLDRLTDEHDRA